MTARDAANGGSIQPWHESCWRFPIIVAINKMDKASANPMRSSRWNGFGMVRGWSH
jgi:hypothetical protein